MAHKYTLQYKEKTYVPAISWYVLVMIKSASFMAIRSAVN
jgi:DNA/RNA endonuclease G (NUC1)